jgi:uncharacterized protein YkwD
VNADTCPGARLKPRESDLSTVRSATLCLVNQERAVHGETPLRLNRRLADAAGRHNQEMLDQGYFEHVSPDGGTPLSRITATGYISSNSHFGYVIGENIAWGTYTDSTAWAIVEGWIASPGHLANILNGRFRDTAIAVSAAVPGTRQAGATYTQDFGVIIH